MKTGFRPCVPAKRPAQVATGIITSCQFLAQRTHPYTSAKKGGKALLEWLCQGVKGVEADGDHPPFPPTDHRSHRPRSWLLNGIKKVEQLRFLENSQRTLGQAALQWLLADDRVASTLPNIYNEEQLVEFAKAPECPSLTDDDMAKIEQLYSENFGIEEEPPKFKGTMELSNETAAA